MDQIKCDLADIKAKLKFLMEKMEKQVSVTDQSIVGNGSNTSLTSPFQAVLGSVPFTESIITSGVAHNGGNVPIPNSGNNSYQMSSSTLPIGGSVPCFEVAYSIPTAPVPGSSQFQLPAVTFSSAMLGSNHLHQLSIHNDNYSNSIPLMEYNMLKFDGGEDVRSWIGKCERVFILENTPQNCKVQRATMALEGSAFIWHRVYTHQKFGISWQDYSQAILKRFDKRKYATKVYSCERSSVPMSSACSEEITISSLNDSNGEYEKVGPVFERIETQDELFSNQIEDHVLCNEETENEVGNCCADFSASGDSTVEVNCSETTIEEGILTSNASFENDSSNVTDYHCLYEGFTMSSQHYFTAKVPSKPISRQSSGKDPQCSEYTQLEEVGFNKSTQKDTQYEPLHDNRLEGNLQFIISQASEVPNEAAEEIISLDEIFCKANYEGHQHHQAHWKNDFISDNNPHQKSLQKSACENSIRSETSLKSFTQKSIQGAASLASRVKEDQAMLELCEDQTFNETPYSPVTIKDAVNDLSKGRGPSPNPEFEVDPLQEDELNSTGETGQPVLEFAKDISSGFDVASSIEEVNVFLVSSKQRLGFLDKMPAWGSEESTVLFEYNDISIEEIEKQLTLRGFKFNEIQEDSNQGGRVGVLQEYWNEDSFGVVLKQFTGKMEMLSSLIQIHIHIIIGVSGQPFENGGLKDGIVWKPHKVPFYTNISYLDSWFYPSDGTNNMNVGNDNKSYEDAEKSYGNVELIGEGVNKTGNHRGFFGHMNINIQISNIENTHDEKYVDKRYNGKGMHKVFGKFIIFIWGWHYKDFVKRRETAHPGSWIIEWKIAWEEINSQLFLLSKIKKKYYQLRRGLKGIECQGIFRVIHRFLLTTPVSRVCAEGKEVITYSGFKCLKSQHINQLDPTKS